MKRLLFALVLVLVGIVCLGFYREWFHLGSDSADGQDHITFTVDEGKIKEDNKKAQQKVHDLRNPEKDNAAGTPEKTAQ